MRHKRKVIDTVKDLDCPHCRCASYQLLPAIGLKISAIFEQPPHFTRVVISQLWLRSYDTFNKTVAGVQDGCGNLPRG
jgi:hypothetical protein